jgi:hypothetical protein
MDLGLDGSVSIIPKGSDGVGRSVNFSLLMSIVLPRERLICFPNA